MSEAPAPPIARVRIERRGGLAGLRPCIDCAWEALEPHQRSALDGLLAAAAGAPPGPQSPGADRFTYRLTLAYPHGADRTLDVAEDAMPPALAAIVRPALP